MSSLKFKRQKKSRGSGEGLKDNRVEVKSGAERRLWAEIYGPIVVSEIKRFLLSWPTSLPLRREATHP